MKKALLTIIRLVTIISLLGGCVCVLPAAAAPAEPSDGKPSLSYDGSDELLAGCPHIAPPQTAMQYTGTITLTNETDPNNDVLGIAFWWNRELEENLIASVNVSGTLLEAGERFILDNTLKAGESLSLIYTVTMVTAAAGWAGGAVAHLNFGAEPLNRIGHQAHLRVSIENTCATAIEGVGLAGSHLSCEKGVPTLSLVFMNYDHTMDSVRTVRIGGHVAASNFPDNSPKFDYPEVVISAGEGFIVPLGFYEAGLVPFLNATIVGSVQEAEVTTPYTVTMQGKNPCAKFNFLPLARR